MSICAASNSPANYQFNYSTSPFTFAVARSDSNGEAIFNTMGQRFVFKVCGVLTHPQCVPPAETADMRSVHSARISRLKALRCCVYWAITLRCWLERRIWALRSTPRQTDVDSRQQAVQALLAWMSKQCSATTELEI